MDLRFNGEAVVNQDPTLVAKVVEPPAATAVPRLAAAVNVEDLRRQRPQCRACGSWRATSRATSHGATPRRIRIPGTACGVEGQRHEKRAETLQCGGAVAAAVSAAPGRFLQERARFDEEGTAHRQRWTSAARKRAR